MFCVLNLEGPLRELARGSAVFSGFGLFIYGVLLTVLVWPFALISDETNKIFSEQCNFICPCSIWTAD